MSHTLELNYCPRCGRALEDREAFGRVRRFCPACELVIFRDH
ncbi:MAG: DNA mismatch repair protein MutT, partial [Chloroflexi bacterium]